MWSSFTKSYSIFISVHISISVFKVTFISCKHSFGEVFFFVCFLFFGLSTLIHVGAFNSVFDLCTKKKVEYRRALNFYEEFHQLFVIFGLFFCFCFFAFLNVLQFTKVLNSEDHFYQRQAKHTNKTSILKLFTVFIRKYPEMMIQSREIREFVAGLWHCLEIKMHETIFSSLFFLSWNLNANKKTINFVLTNSVLSLALLNCYFTLTVSIIKWNESRTKRKLQQQQQ